MRSRPPCTPRKWCAAHRVVRFSGSSPPPADRKRTWWTWRARWLVQPGTVQRQPSRSQIACSRRSRALRAPSRAVHSSRAWSHMASRASHSLDGRPRWHSSRRARTQARSACVGSPWARRGSGHPRGRRGRRPAPGRRRPAKRSQRKQALLFSVGRPRGRSLRRRRHSHAQEGLRYRRHAGRQPPPKIGPMEVRRPYCQAALPHASHPG